VSFLSPLRHILRNGNPLLNSLEMPLLASAFYSVLPHVICGQPTGRECATQLSNNCRGARLMGIRAKCAPGGAHMALPLWLSVSAPSRGNPNAKIHVSLLDLEPMARNDKSSLKKSSAAELHLLCERSSKAQIFIQRTFFRYTTEPRTPSRMAHEAPFC